MSTPPSVPDRGESLRMLEREIGVLMRRVRRVVGERARETHPELQAVSYTLLSYLAARGPLRSSELADLFNVDKGGISRQVQHLVDLGLAERLPDPEDRRAALVAATPDALERLTANSARRLGVLDARLAAWDDAKLAGFVEMLAHYNAMLVEPISLANEPDEETSEPADPEGRPARLS